MTYLGTSDLARAVGVHPNTVRRYLDRGVLPPVERSPAGYRRFTQRHLDCLRLAHLVYRPPYAGKGIYQSAVRVLQTAVGGDLDDARALATDHLALVQAERAEADLAADLLQRWAQGASVSDTVPAPLRIGQVAQLLGVTIDMLRNWDRNGLLDVPRDPDNGYRRYGPADVGRLRIIRVLSRSGFSVAAILRMLLQLDRGQTTDLRRALDTPRPDEDAHLAADRWISTLAAHEQRAHAVLALLDEISVKQDVGGR